MRTRREVVVAGLLAATGCVDVLPDRGPPGVELAPVTIVNTDDRSHEVAVTISREGEAVQSGSYSLGETVSDRGATIEPTWPAGPAVFSVTATGNDQTREASFEDPAHYAGDDDCIGVTIQFDFDGTLGIYAGEPKAGACDR